MSNSSTCWTCKRSVEPLQYGIHTVSWKINVQYIVCTKIYAKQWNGSYSKLLQMLWIPSLKQCRILHPSTVFKIIHGLFQFSTNVFVKGPTTSQNYQSFVCPYVHTHQYFNSFVPCTVRIGNTLSSHTVVSLSQLSVLSFKQLTGIRAKLVVNVTIMLYCVSFVLCKKCYT